MNFFFFSKKNTNRLLVRLDNCHITYPFLGNNAKSKIATYQLKKSQLDFRLVLRCNQTGEFIDLNVSCRTNALLEGNIFLFIFVHTKFFSLAEEGTECRKTSRSPLL